MKIILKVAGVYNILWGILVVLFPTKFFDMPSLEVINYPMIWQSVGMIVGVYGIGYYMAARNYIQHYIIVLVGFLGKAMGAIGIIWFVLIGQLSPLFLIVTLFNDIIWLYPFSKMLLEAWIEHKFKL